MGLLENIAAWLITENEVQQLGKDLFLDYDPPKVTNCIILYEYGGLPQAPQEKAVHRSVQMVSKYTDPQVGRELLWEAYKLLQDQQENSNRVNFTNSSWGQVNLRNVPTKLKTDAQNNIYYAFNIGITTQTD